MRTVSSDIRQWTVRLLCALAVVFVGFGAQPAISNSDQLTPAELAQYRLPDGTLPIFCITYRDADGKAHGEVHIPGCYLCQTAPAALLPAAPVFDYGHLPFVFARLAAPLSVAFHRRLYPPNSGPRAPPLLSIVA